VACYPTFKERYNTGTELRYCSTGQHQYSKVFISAHLLIDVFNAFGIPSTLNLRLCPDGVLVRFQFSSSCEFETGRRKKSTTGKEEQLVNGDAVCTTISNNHIADHHSPSHPAPPLANASNPSLRVLNGCNPPMTASHFGHLDTSESVPFAQLCNHKRATF
jgi:hypothetical protein